VRESDAKSLSDDANNEETMLGTSRTDKPDHERRGGLGSEIIIDTSPLEGTKHQGEFNDIHNHFERMAVAEEGTAVM
jgi:hypothetical protein